MLNLFTEKKRREKLHDMHGNPVKRGWLAPPEQWVWSSFRFYYLEDASGLRRDRLDSLRHSGFLQKRADLKRKLCASPRSIWKPRLASSFVVASAKLVCISQTVLQ